jgi:hypothetical protein
MSKEFHKFQKISSEPEQDKMAYLEVVDDKRLEMGTENRIFELF